MLDPVVAHAPHSHLTALDRILHCPPALQPGLLSAVRTVQQEQIDIAKPALLHRSLDGLTRPIVDGVRSELAGEMDVFAFEAVDVGGTGDESFDSDAGFVLVMVHLRGVDAGKVVLVVLVGRC